MDSKDIVFTDEMMPSMFSGDGVNPRVGPLTAPFAIYDLADGETVQVTFSPASESAEEVQVISVMRYPTPAGRRKD